MFFDCFCCTLFNRKTLSAKAIYGVLYDFPRFSFKGNLGDSSSMLLGRFSHLYDLMDMGNKAFRENRFEE
ncbi:hypothetical protein L1987_64727 [Smallanthus sonchifolius]|uniref:Uncharacterized protein n=1 Tax=Smallanthus sonchifolius TaxID=185202 RepID=A0ACB9BSR3_9ASTR|nr:hypothetical protein L1987_64727 [Smallanthus sonchifolius]